MNHLWFSRKTFAYFEQAKQNENTRAWFDSSRQEYEENVVVPFTHLIVQMRERLGSQLPGVDLSAKVIVKPLRRQVEGLEEPVVRSKATAFFSEPATSMFESNPGIYISLGAAADENVHGVGLHDISSRQMKLLRTSFLSDHVSADASIRSRTVEQHWGGLAALGSSVSRRAMGRRHKERNTSGISSFS